MTRMEQLLVSMYPTTRPLCQHVVGAHLVIDEYPPGEMRDQAKAEISDMAECLRNLCRHYNNLRALVARIEREAGNEHPVFYAGEIRPADGEPTSGCNCWQISMENPKCPSR